jgi:hypothetical protein
MSGNSTNLSTDKQNGFWQKTFNPIEHVIGHLIQGFIITMIAYSLMAFFTFVVNTTLPATGAGFPINQITFFIKAAEAFTGLAVAVILIVTMSYTLFITITPPDNIVQRVHHVVGFKWCRQGKCPRRKPSDADKVTSTDPVIKNENEL